MTRNTAIDLLKEQLLANKSPEEVMTFLEETLDMVRYVQVRDGATVGWEAPKLVSQSHAYDHGYGTYRRDGKYLEFNHKGPHFSLPSSFTYDFLTLRLYYNANLTYPIYGSIEVPAWAK